MKKIFAFALVAFSLLSFPFLAFSQDSGSSSVPLTASRMQFINFANTMLGVEFRLGGEKPETGFDSFGLIKYSAMKSLGKKLSKDPQKLFDSMESHPKRKELIPGDIVFFKSNPNGNITDAGIYMGVYQVEGNLQGKEVFIFSSARPMKIGKRKRTRPSVAIADMNDYVWKNQYAGAGRFLSEKDATIEAMTAEETESIFDTEKVSASDFENVSKDLDGTQIESGVTSQFVKAEESAAELESVLKKTAEDIAGGVGKFRAMTADKKLELLTKAADAVKKMPEFAEFFATAKESSSTNATASTTKVTSASIGAIPVSEAAASREEFIRYCMTLRGIPYKWGGTTKRGFDCSGFVQFSALHGVNISLPRTASEMSNYAKPISRSEMEPGDLVFFKSRGKVNHVGVYLGRYQGSGRLSGREVFINAASAGPSTGVTLSALDEPTWKRTFFRPGRILPATDTASQLNFAVASLLK